MKVLIVDDDKNIAQFIADNFVKAAHTAMVAADGQSGLALATEESFDLYIIDWMMPVLDGISLMQALRARDKLTPAIILTAKSHLEDKLIGLRSGCDDYLTKPFAIEELIARAELLFRRMEKSSALFDAAIMRLGDLTLDRLSHEVHYQHKLIPLQAREYKILLFLLENKDKIITRSMLLEHVWEYQFDPQTNVTDVHISRLRNKLAEAGLVNIIHTVRGLGYCLKGDK